MDNALQKHDWEKIWQSSMARMNEATTIHYWDKRAEDYDDFIRTSEFGYGRRMCEILESEGVLGEEIRVLEIASGVGAVTLPMCLKTDEVTAIEPSRQMAVKLRLNSLSWGVSNLEIVEQTFQEFAAGSRPQKHDLVFMCHASWQFPDSAELIRSMERQTVSMCCLADTMGVTEDRQREMYRQLGIASTDLDRSFYLFNILCRMGRAPNLAVINHDMRRSKASAEAMWCNLVGKYRTPEPEDVELIKTHVDEHSKDGVYSSPGTMALMWWEAR